MLAASQQHDEALACFDKLIAIQADFADAHFARGNALSKLGRVGEAIESFDKAIAIDPDHVNALNNKGNALHQLGRIADAITCYDRILTLKPAYVPAIANRGAAFKDLREADKAIADFDRALAINPDFAEAWVNRGEALLNLRRLDDALASYDRALSIAPEEILAWLGRANILMLTQKLADATAACQHALAIDPNSVKALTQLAQCHASQGDAETAVSYFDLALAIKPDDEVALSSKIFSLDFSADGDFARHQAARSEWWRQVGSKISTQRPSQYENNRNPARRIVVGYVSADFKTHSAAFALLPVLENHDKTQFEVICYSGSATEDDMTKSFRQVADQWRDVLQWSDDRLVDCIRADKVDILIDLSGHSYGNRLRAFARKPAPIQVSAWGHATGTGMPTIDYLLSDPVIIPSEVRHLFAEQIYDLPSVMIIEPPPAALRCSEPPVAFKWVFDLRFSQQGEQVIQRCDWRLGADSAVRCHIAIADQGLRARRCPRSKHAPGKICSPRNSAGSDMSLSDQPPARNIWRLSDKSTFASIPFRMAGASPLGSRYTWACRSWRSSAME